MRGRSFAAPVLSIIAIVLAIGGVSYAATQLPKNSVGPSQLRRGAVHQKALSFPAGVTGASRRDLGDVVGTGFCVSVNGVDPPCLPPAINDSFAIPVRAKRPGMLHVTGNVELVGTGVAGRSEDGSATAKVGVSVDGKPVNFDTESTVTYRQRLVVPFEKIVPIRVGTHKVTLNLTGDGYNYVNVKADQATMTATVLPGAG